MPTFGLICRSLLENVGQACKLYGLLLVLCCQTTFFYMRTGDLAMTIDVDCIHKYHTHEREDTLARPDLFLAQGFIA